MILGTSAMMLAPTAADGEGVVEHRDQPSSPMAALYVAQPGGNRQRSPGGRATKRRAQPPPDASPRHHRIKGDCLASDAWPTCKVRQQPPRRPDIAGGELIFIAASPISGWSVRLRRRRTVRWWAAGAAGLGRLPDGVGDPPRQQRFDQRRPFFLLHPRGQLAADRRWPSPE